MIGKIYAILCVISLFFALILGKIENVCMAVMEGANNAITLTISLLGVMCLWCGIMRVVKSIGMITALSRFLSPILRFLFPATYRCGNGIDEISATLTANVLGIGNAATPLAVKAMEKMAENNKNNEYASDDMVTFTVLNTASVNFLPTTLIALRHSAGSRNPFEILVPVWICSFSCAIVSVFFSKTLRVFSGVKKG